MLTFFWVSRSPRNKNYSPYADDGVKSRGSAPVFASSALSKLEGGAALCSWIARLG